MAEKTENGIKFFFKIFDGLWDYAELTEVMNETKLKDILLELKGVLDKYPVL